ncbi:MAG: hypothetical protein DRP08_01475 [Candidatus Aenigmatarchaeota archaeon]|nr:MAG: hypothetical protein DRP08_01475 [Candidatus Aenigmarchaeota archaeon]
MQVRLVSVCPFCHKALRINVFEEESSCEGSNEMICNEIHNCKHFRWVPVGNKCYEDPASDVICRGVEKLKRVALDKVIDGTTVWLLVPT